MIEKNMQSWDGLRAEAYGIVRNKPEHEKYDYVIVDEAQDLTPFGIRLAVELCKHPGGLYFTADVNQKLYQNGFSWQRLHESLKFNRHNTFTLEQNYRNTQEIVEAAKSFMTQIARDADDVDTLRFHGASSGHKPNVLYTTPDTEIAKLKQVIRDTQCTLKLPLGKIAILVAGDTDQAYARGTEIAKALKESGVSANYMASKDLRLDARCVKVMSLYTSKGLEFPAVIILDVHDGVLPRHVPHLPAEERKQEEARDMRLLFVGMTRAMRQLTLVAQEDKKSTILLDLSPEHWSLPS
jgi:superfamily I DNA/RNA helicase